MNPITRFRRLIALALAVLAFSVLTAACGSGWGDDGSDSADVTYAPAAYWQTVDNVRSCFYFGTDLTDGLAQVALLQAAGLCPDGSMPVAAPLYWAEEYYPYYSSPAYYNAYVPSSYRSTYTHVTVVHFSTTYKTQIKAASAKAVYKSSTGGTVTGSKVASRSFGGGSRSTTSYGGGSRSGSGASSGYSSSRSSTSVSRSAGRK